MAEEHRCQAPPEGHRLCANNCGFFGSPATLNLCSKCYRDHRLKEEQANSAKIAVEKSLLASSSSSSSPSSSALASPSAAASVAAAAAPPPLSLKEEEGGASATPAAPQKPQRRPGRCTACRKRVGLTGFKCRCGETYCGGHRYPEQHECTFDFKGAGRAAIARDNPVVKADKLERI